MPINTEQANGPRAGWLGLLLCATPLIHYLFTLLFYVCASASLGEWADPMGGHDPKGFFGGIPAFLSIVLMILSFAVGPLVIFHGYRKKRISQYLIIYGLSLVFSIALFRIATPWLGTWIAD